MTDQRVRSCEIGKYMTHHNHGATSLVSKCCPRTVNKHTFLIAPLCRACPNIWDATSLTDEIVSPTVCPP